MDKKFYSNIKNTLGGIVADGCMKMNDGYAGKYLRVDLTKRKIEVGKKT